MMNDDNDVVNESGVRVRCFEVNKRDMIKSAFEKRWWYRIKSDVLERKRRMVVEAREVDERMK